MAETKPSPRTPSQERYATVDYGDYQARTDRNIPAMILWSRR
jgi:hypothetical protein